MVAVQERNLAGISLLGALKIQSPKKVPESKAVRALLDEVGRIRDMRSAVASFGSTQSSLGDMSAVLQMFDKECVTPAADAASRVLSIERIAQFRETQHVSETLGRVTDFTPTLEPTFQDRVLLRMCRSPRMDLADARHLSTATGFPIYPVAYMSDEGYMTDDDEHPTRVATAAFAKAANSVGYVAYVLAPPMYYGLMKHAEAKDPNMSVYLGNNPAFLMIPNMVEALRTVVGRVSVLEHGARAAGAQSEQMRSHVAMLARSMQDVQERQLAQNAAFAQEVAALHAKIDGVKADAERRAAAQAEQVRALAQSARQAEATAQAASARAAAAEQRAEESARMRFFAQDPVMLAFPKGCDLNTGNAWGFVGPCWGPDSLVALAQARELGILDPHEQDRSLRETINALWAD